MIVRISSDVLEKFSWGCWSSGGKLFCFFLLFFLFWSQSPVFSWLGVDVLIVIHASSVSIVIERVLSMSVMLVVLLVLMKGLNWHLFLRGFGSIVFSFWASSEFPA